MTLHILKLCVGVDTVDDLRASVERRVAARQAAGEEAVLRHVTRMTPKRGEEIAGSGSLYWVIRGFIQVRQPVLRLDPVVDAEGVSRCAFVLAPELVVTRKTPRRPFQGWRYLTVTEAPPDEGEIEGDDDMPAEMRRELADLGLL